MTQSASSLKKTETATAKARSARPRKGITETQERLQDKLSELATGAARQKPRGMSLHEIRMARATLDHQAAQERIRDSFSTSQSDEGEIVELAVLQAILREDPGAYPEACPVGRLIADLLFQVQLSDVTLEDVAKIVDQDKDWWDCRQQVSRKLKEEAELEVVLAAKRVPKRTAA